MNKSESDNESDEFESAEESLDEENNDGKSETFKEAKVEVMKPAAPDDSTDDKIQTETEKVISNLVSYRKRPEKPKALVKQTSVTSKNNTRNETIFKTDIPAPEVFFQEITTNLSKNINRSLNTIQQTSSNVKDLILGSLPVTGGSENVSFSYDDTKLTSPPNMPDTNVNRVNNNSNNSSNNNKNIRSLFAESVNKFQYEEIPAVSDKMSCQNDISRQKLFGKQLKTSSILPEGCDAFDLGINARKKQKSLMKFQAENIKQRDLPEETKKSVNEKFNDTLSFFNSREYCESSKLIGNNCDQDIAADLSQPSTAHVLSAFEIIKEEDDGASDESSTVKTKKNSVSRADETAKRKPEKTNEGHGKLFVSNSTAHVPAEEGLSKQSKKLFPFSSEGTPGGDCEESVLQPGNLMSLESCLKFCEKLKCDSSDALVEERGVKTLASKGKARLIGWDNLEDVAIASAESLNKDSEKPNEGESESAVEKVHPGDACENEGDRSKEENNVCDEADVKSVKGNDGWDDFSDGETEDSADPVSSEIKECCSEQNGNYDESSYSCRKLSTILSSDMNDKCVNSGSGSQIDGALLESEQRDKDEKVEKEKEVEPQESGPVETSGGDGWDEWDDWGAEGDSKDASKRDFVSDDEAKEDEAGAEAAQIKPPNLNPEIWTGWDTFGQKSEDKAQSNWGSWGVNLLLNKASAVTQGISNVFEAGIGAPDPVTLARMEAARAGREKVGREEEEARGGESKTSLGFAVSDASLFQSFGISSLVAGVTSKIVDHSKLQEIGSKVITGGLDTLESFGKKTMEVLQEGDPGLRNKRALFMPSSAPVLSQVLREIRDKAEKEMKEEKLKQMERQCHFESLFDDYQGLIHLEALEMLSKQCELKLGQVRESMKPEELEDLDGVLEEVEQLCSLDDYDLNLCSTTADFKTSLTTAVDPLKEEIAIQRLEQIQEKVHRWLNSLAETKLARIEIEQNLVSTLAEFTAAIIQQFHKTGELLSVKECRKTVEEIDALSQMTHILSMEITNICDRFVVVSKSMLKGTESLHPLLCKIDTVMKNATTYIRQAFKLLIPILQKGAAV